MSELTKVVTDILVDSPMAPALINSKNPVWLHNEFIDRMAWCGLTPKPTNCANLPGWGIGMLLCVSPTYRDIIGVRMTEQFDNIIECAQVKLKEVHAAANDCGRLRVALINLNVKSMDGVHK